MTTEVRRTSIHYKCLGEVSWRRFTGVLLSGRRLTLNIALRATACDEFTTFSPRGPNGDNVSRQPRCPWAAGGTTAVLLSCFLPPFSWGVPPDLNVPAYPNFRPPATERKLTGLLLPRAAVHFTSIHQVIVSPRVGISRKYPPMFIRECSSNLYISQYEVNEKPSFVLPSIGHSNQIRLQHYITRNRSLAIYLAYTHPRITN